MQANLSHPKNFLHRQGNIGSKRVEIYLTREMLGEGGEAISQRGEFLTAVVHL